MTSLENDSAPTPWCTAPGSRVAVPGTAGERAPWTPLDRLLPDRPPAVAGRLPDLTALIEALRPPMRQLAVSIRFTADAMHRTLAPLTYRDYRAHWRRCLTCRASLGRGTVAPLKVDGTDYARRRRARRRNRR
ncbi:hypothetical protein [Actinoallomurus sp. NPDC052274]|uniref:hypothetical protein n=1 Tax=Actinoallomurus sp. NPDC052274 TaxID=3155420 RepID=UPI00342715C0